MKVLAFKRQSIAAPGSSSRLTAQPHNSSVRRDALERGAAPARAGSRPRRRPTPSGRAGLAYRWEKRLGRALEDRTGSVSRLDQRSHAQDRGPSLIIRCGASASSRPLRREGINVSSRWSGAS